MSPEKQDEVREQRITMEIVVDAYRTHLRSFAYRSVLFQLLWLTQAI